ncbi:MAG TPA: ASKHA domain-containing protein [Syntrophobacteraceae bacterium]|nr:ASKHA domain-containing protein [Syntrophobacteraceae bacterium]
MINYKIKFLPHGKQIAFPESGSVLHAAMEAGVHVNASCGGEGLCGKCRVIIEEGHVEGGISERLSNEDLNAGYRLACLSRIKSDLTVRVPVESEIDASVLTAVPPRRTARIQQMNLDDLKSKGLFIPPVEKRYIELPEPSSIDNLADTSRLVNFLRTKHNEHRLVVRLPVIRKIPGTLREAGFKVTATLARPVFEGGKSHIINLEPGDTTGRNFAIAVDIGTTTIYGQLIDLVTGDVLAEHGDFNGQISYGEDIISRIIYATKPGGLDTLNEVVIRTINRIIDRVIEISQVDRQQVSTITFAGNTTMTQIFLKINPTWIRLSPYVPATTLYPPVRAVDLGIDLADHATALVYPSISSFIGGDIVAGVMGSGIHLTDGLSLYIDIGTNAEIVIGNKDWLACAACSAGPAFEGGGIQFGMRADRGAIEDFSIDPFSLEPMILTVGNVRPRGICGSGLINITARLFEARVINNIGKFDRDLNSDRLRENDGVYEYVLAQKHKSALDRDIVITENDIGNLIRAKGAIFSGCQTLLEAVGYKIADIDRIVLAGGFGSHIDIEMAMTIGLLPEIDPDKITYIGNGSLLGARMCAVTNWLRKDVVNVMKRMTNFELSETPSYMARYVAALFLPHTDLDLFQKVKGRLYANRRLEAVEGS